MGRHWSRRLDAQYDRVRQVGSGTRGTALQRLGVPTEVSYGAAQAALENYTMSAEFELAVGHHCQASVAHSLTVPAAGPGTSVAPS